MLYPPFYSTPTQNVQFFGVHMAQVKISRDWYASDTHPLICIYPSKALLSPNAAGEEGTFIFLSSLYTLFLTRTSCIADSKLGQVWLWCR